MRSRTFSAMLGCVAALAFSAAPASATPAAAEQPQQDHSALVRGALFSPDTRAVDVYLSDVTGGSASLAFSNVGYGDVSQYQRVRPGLYSVSIRPAGASPFTPAMFSWTLDAKPDSAFTALAIGMRKSLEGRVLPDDLNPPPAGQARVRVIQAAGRAKTVKVTGDDGLVLAAKVPFAGTTDYTTVPATSWPVTTRSLEQKGLTATKDVALKGGGANTLVVLDEKDKGISMRVVHDVLGTDLTPIASSESGGHSALLTLGRSEQAKRVALAGLGALTALAAPVLLFGVRRRADAL